MIWGFFSLPSSKMKRESECAKLNVQRPIKYYYKKWEGSKFYVFLEKGLVIEIVRTPVTMFYLHRNWSTTVPLILPGHLMSFSIQCIWRGKHPRCLIMSNEIFTYHWDTIEGMVTRSVWLVFYFTPCFKLHLENTQRRLNKACC